MQTQAAISATIKILQNLIKTVLRDSPDQKERKSKINEVLHGRSKSYAVFKNELGRMSGEEQHYIRLGELPWLWKEFPQKLDLDYKVGNPDDPGDGLLYSESDVNKAIIVLKELYDAWSETTYVRSGMSGLLPKVGQMTSMPKICLILYGMKQERLVDCFCESQKRDVDLPLSTETVEQIMYQDPSHAATFATEQYRAVNRKWEDGGHIEIPEEEPLPLCFDGNLGTGLYATVQRYRDPFKPEFYAVKERISADGRDHLQREIAQLKKVSHRHIVQFVKSYQRGSRYGLLIRPAATTDLEKLLERYRKNNYHYQKHTEEPRKARVLLKPVMLTAFGCLSHSLCHIHGRRILHGDIKPVNILYEKEYSKDRPARFLWADFGFGYFGGTGSSKTRSFSQFSTRYSAPEIHTNQDTDEESEASLEPESYFFNTRPANGRPSDIFSFGCVFLEILSAMTDAEIPKTESGSYQYWRHITELQAWAESQKNLLEPSSPLRVPFKLAVEMIRLEAMKRPSIDKIVEILENADAAKEYFCAPCFLEIKKSPSLNRFNEFLR